MRNIRKLSSFKDLPDSLRKFAAEQDAVGWREFTEGRISKSLFEAQEEHLSQEGGRVHISRRTCGLITRVLHITQAHWIH